jgi:hypothetical protein
VLTRRARVEDISRHRFDSDVPLPRERDDLGQSLAVGCALVDDQPDKSPPSGTQRLADGVASVE